MYKPTPYYFFVILFTLFNTTLFGQAIAGDQQMIVIFDPNLTEPEIIDLLTSDYNFEIVEGPTPVTRAYLTQPIDGIFPPWAYNNPSGPINGVILTAQSSSDVNGAGLNYYTSDGAIEVPSGDRICPGSGYSLSISNLGLSNTKAAIFDTGILNFAFYPTSISNYNPFHYGFNFINPDLNPIDDNGHGTHMANVIDQQITNAFTNTINPIGVPPIDIDIHKTHNELGKGNIWDKIQALDQSIIDDVNIVNMSFSFLESYDYRFDEHAPFSIALDHALASGMLCIASAGNDSRSNDDLFREFSNYPASNLHDNILSVAAIDCNGNLIPESNYGIESVDIAAPGLKIPGLNHFGNIWFLNGTSPATALVSSIAIQLATHQSRFDYESTKCAIMNGGTNSSALDTKILSGNYVNADGAIDALLSGDPCNYMPSITFKVNDPKNTSKLAYTYINGSLSMTFHAKNAQSTMLYVSNILGQVIATKNIQLYKGQTEIAMDLPQNNHSTDGATAIYFLHTQIDGQVKTITITH